MHLTLHIHDGHVGNDRVRGIVFGEYITRTENDIWRRTRHDKHHKGLTRFAWNRWRLYRRRSAATFYVHGFVSGAMMFHVMRGGTVVMNEIGIMLLYTVLDCGELLEWKSAQCFAMLRHE